MKYSNLMQICDYLRKFKKLDYIKRVADNIFYLRFDENEELFFDMDKTNSNIHKNDNFIETKIYKAPFDIILQKRFNKSKILSMEVMKNNRILHIKTIQSRSYKNLETNIYFEFTGRFTNVIITDQKDIILEALRHFDNDYRSIRVSHALKHLKPIPIKEQYCKKIENFNDFFKSEFKKLNETKILNLKSAKLAQIDKKLTSLKNNLSSLPKQNELEKEALQICNKAKLLTANLYKLDDFQREINLYDFNGDIVKFNIPDTPKNSARLFFEQSKKLKQKAQNIHIEKENLQNKMNFYTSLQSLIKASDSIEEINVLMPKSVSKRKQNEFLENVENFYIKDFKISVGKNEKGNIYLLKNSLKNDFWFHIKDLPSAHVIVKSNKQNLDDFVINFAAKICVNMSVKNPGNYLVDYTKRFNVKIIQGAFVNYINYKTVSVLKPE